MSNKKTNWWALIGLSGAISFCCLPFALYEQTGVISYAVYGLAILNCLIAGGLFMSLNEIENKITKMEIVKNDDENNA